MSPDETKMSPEVTDSKRHEFGFGEGGVPWFLLLGYLSFLGFFTWYVVTFQLADFAKHSPFGSADSVQEAPAD